MPCGCGKRADKVVKKLGYILKTSPFPQEWTYVQGGVYVSVRREVLHKKHFRLTLLMLLIKFLTIGIKEE